jgi:hypothetical protein
LARDRGQRISDPVFMFARYFLELDLPFDEVERALLRSPKDWVPGVAADAEARGELLLAEVGFGRSAFRLGKRVEIVLGDPMRFPSKTILPMSWRPEGGQPLFPSLDADIEVAALGPTRAQLSVSARYRPPLGVLGRVVDRALLHRVAEATLKDFLDQAGGAIRALVPALA